MAIDQKQRNAELYARIQSGDTYAANCLIEENLPLVIHRADALLKASPQWEYLRDDLVSEGNLALTVAVRHLEKPHQQKRDVNGFLIRSISASFSRLMDGDALVGAADRTIRKSRKTGDPLDQPKRADADPASLSEDDHRRRLSQRDGGLSAVDLRDQLEGCCDSPLDRDIVRLRAEGMTDAQIADWLGKSQQTVNAHRNQIESRYNDHCLALSA